MRELVLETDEACAAGAREFVADCLDRSGVSSDHAFEILLALNEAVANSCRHAYAGESEGKITVRCGCDDAEIVLSVADRGKGFAFNGEMFEMPDPLSARGRGFFMMQELMDSVEIHSDEKGSMVTLRRTVARVPVRNGS